MPKAPTKAELERRLTLLTQRLAEETAQLEAAKIARDEILGTLATTAYETNYYRHRVQQLLREIAYLTDEDSGGACA